MRHTVLLMESVTALLAGMEVKQVNWSGNPAQLYFSQVKLARLKMLSHIDLTSSDSQDEVLSR